MENSSKRRIHDAADAGAGVHDMVNAKDALLKLHEAMGDRDLEDKIISFLDSAECYRVDNSSRFNDQDDFFEALYPPDWNDTEGRSKFLNNFLQMFFREDKLGLLGPIIVSKPWRKKADSVASELIEPIRDVFDESFTDSNITNDKIPTLTNMAGDNLPDFKKALYIIYLVSLASVSPDELDGVESAHEVITR